MKIATLADICAGQLPAYRSIVKTNTAGSISKREVGTHATNKSTQRTDYGSVTVHVNDSLKSADGRDTSKSQQAVSKI
jgi:hypothetical protein